MPLQMKGFLNSRRFLSLHSRSLTILKRKMPRGMPQTICNFLFSICIFTRLLFGGACNDNSLQAY